MNSVQIGAMLEDVAVAYLQKNNLTILHRNFRCKAGEIDLIARDQDCLVFTEVRFRKNDYFGSAAESIDARKQRKIILTAQFYLQTRKWTRNINSRFDVIAISEAQNSPQIEWIKDAFNE